MSDLGSYSCGYGDITFHLAGRKLSLNNIALTGFVDKYGMSLWAIPVNEYIPIGTEVTVYLASEYPRPYLRGKVTYTKFNDQGLMILIEGEFPDD